MPTLRSELKKFATKYKRFECVVDKDEDGLCSITLCLGIAADYVSPIYIDGYQGQDGVFATLHDRGWCVNQLTKHGYDVANPGVIDMMSELCARFGCRMIFTDTTPKRPTVVYTTQLDDDIDMALFNLLFMSMAVGEVWTIRHPQEAWRKRVELRGNQ